MVFRSDKTSLLFYQSVFVFIVSITLYLSTLEKNFVYDDAFTVINNYLIRSWHNIPAIFTDDYFTDAGEASYRPVVTLSYFVDYSLWRLNPAGYHLTNLLLHGLNGVLSFFLFIRFCNVGWRNEPHKASDAAFSSPSKTLLSVREPVKTLAPFVASLIFCTHPLFTEVVNAVSYREDLLAATFYFAAFLFYHRAYRRNSIPAYVISLCCYLMGLFSKEMAITFPALVVLHDILSLGRRRFAARFIRYYAGYLFATVFYMLLRFVFLRNPTGHYMHYPMDSFWVNLLTMTKVVASYIKLLFFPVNLNADYVVPNASSPAEMSFVLSLLLIVSVVVIAWRVFFCSKKLFFSVAWFFIALLPILNIVPIDNIMAERYLYIPLAGFCMIGGQLFRWIPNPCLKEGVFNSGNFIFLLIVILMGFCWQTCHRSRVWFNDLSLWSATVKSSPQSPRAHNNVGVLYKKMGFFDAAVQEYTTAIQIRPDYSEAHSNLANIYQEKGISILGKQSLPETTGKLIDAGSGEGYLRNAIAEYKKAIEISPFNEVAHFNLGVVYGKVGLTDSAETEYENVISINNKNPHAHNNLGNIYEDRGMLESALTEYTLSLSVNPDSAITHNNIGNVYLKKGRIDEAIQEYGLAVKNEPMGIVYHENLGNAYIQKGFTEETISEFELAVKLSPKNSNYYRKLIMLYCNYKRDDEKAIFYLRKLSELEPGQREAIDRMIERIGTKK